MQQAAGQLLKSFRATVCGHQSVFYAWRSVPQPYQRPVGSGQSSCYPRTCVPTFRGYRCEHCRRTASTTWWFDCSSIAIFLQPFYHACLKIHIPLFWGRRLRFQHDGAPAHYGYIQQWFKASGSVVFYVYGSVHRWSVLIVLTRCNTKQSIYYSASSLYTFRVSTTPVIRSTQNCNYIIRYWSYFCTATFLQRGQASLATMELQFCVLLMTGVVDTRKV